MKVVIDMNLSPSWAEVLVSAGLDAIHWSAVGPSNATDAAVMEWAVRHQYIVFTHDLDFGAILAATAAAGPSVIQLRAQDVLPQALGDTLIKAIDRFRAELESGAIVSVDPDQARARILPLER